MRAKWSERRSACTRPGGASNTPNADVGTTSQESRLRAAFLFAVWAFFEVAMIKVGVVGGTGYTGIELLRLLARHPQCDLVAITSRKEAGTPVADLFPSLRGAVALSYSDPAKTDLARCDVVFFATPNTVAMGRPRRSSRPGCGSSISPPIFESRTWPSGRSGTRSGMPLPSSSR